MLSALQDFQNKLGIWISQEMGRELEELDTLQLTLTRANVTLALQRVLDKQIKAKNIPPTSTGRYSEENVKKAVNNKWPTIKATAEGIFGPDAVDTSQRGKLIITVWEGVDLPTGKGKVTKTSQFPRGGIADFKKVFSNILKDLGVNVNAFRTTDNKGATLRGDDAFGHSFSTSHKEGSTIGQRSAMHLRQKISGSRVAAEQNEKEFLKAGDLERAAEMAGRESFYSTILTEMNNIVPAATTVRAYTGKTEKISGSEVPGSVLIDLEFDELEAQTAIGMSKKIDVRPLREQFEEWAATWEKTLEDRLIEALKNPNDPLNVYELRGSDSKRVAIEKIAERALVDNIVKGSKGEFKAAKKTQKPKVSGNQKAKKKHISKSKPKRSRTIRKANTSKPRNATKRRATPWRNRGGINPIGLKELIQKSLPEHIARKMTGPPTLQYQTGRFARSAEITDIAPLPNSVEIRYDYMQDPYRVFEPGSGSPLATRGRDPRQLIGSSIREIAQSIMGDRFGLVRTKRV
tara:strand:+ start:3318 stop:4871 length:1554 start_codon:yes stop_codon:yes gene_type:complete